MFKEDQLMPNAVGHEPELVLTVTFHPIPNKFSAYDKDNNTAPSRLQRTIFLGSQTLAALRDALVCASAAVPTELDSVPDVSVDSTRSARTELDHEKKSFGWRYGKDKWKAGAVIIMDGKIYGDVRPGMTDYTR